jgi:drug/metabolite transporter (DMT)-like permease
MLAGVGFGRVDLLLFSVSLIWGVNYTVIKAALTQFEPLTFNALRFAIAAVLLYLAARLSGQLQPMPRRDLIKLLSVGVFGNCLYQIVFIQGINLTLAGNAAVILGATPVFTALLSALIGHERLGRLSVIGVAASFVGVLLIAFAGHREISFGTRLTGDLLMLACSILWALYTVGLRPFTVKYGYLEVSRWIMIAVAVPLLLVSTPSLISQSWSAISLGGWGALLFSAGAAIAFAFTIWSYCVRRIGSTRTSAYSNLTPVIGLVVAWLFLGERAAVGQLVGMGSIFLGITLTRIDRKNYVEEDMSLSSH